MKTENRINVETEPLAVAIKKDKAMQLVNQMKKDLTKDEAIEALVMYIMQTEELEEQVTVISEQRDRAIGIMQKFQEGEGKYWRYNE
jgi:hypothetical protein